MPAKEASTGLSGKLARLAPVPDAPDKPMPTEQPRPAPDNVHVPVVMARDMKTDLDNARVKDGIELAARVRAMIRLWQDDPEIRDKVDRLAPSMRRKYRHR